MRHTVNFILLIICFAMLGSTAFANEQQKQAIEAAKIFTTIIDSGNIQAAYWSGSELLRLANDEQDWVNQTERTQRLLGNVIQRELKTVRPVPRFPGLPDDDYLIVYFNARTARKASAAEVLLVHQNGGIFQVCAYSIR